MSIKSNIQQVAFKQALKKQVRQNRVKLHPFNFAKAKSFAFLFDISEGKQHYTDKILPFAAKLRKKGKEVLLTAYTNALVKPENIDFPCFCKKDLNWALVPKGEVVGAFLKKEYDVLIDFCFEECPPLDFLRMAAATHFRIGYYQEHRTEFYDLMVHNPGANFDTMLSQMEYGMGIINK